MFCALLFIPLFVAIPLLVAEHGFVLSMKPAYYLLVIGIQLLIIAASKQATIDANKRICVLMSALCIMNTYVPLMVYIGNTDFMDRSMILDAGWYDSWITVTATIGATGTMLIFIALLLLQKSFTSLLQTFTYSVSKKTMQILAYSSAGLALVMIVTTSVATASHSADAETTHPAATEQVVVTVGDRDVIQPLQLPTNQYHTNAKENVIIVQMESANALLFNGYGTDEVGPSTYKKYIPSLTAIAKENGVLLPMFWSNGIQTGRAMSSILCGTVNNIDKSLTETPAKIPHDCLPELLRTSGYTTHFYSAHPNPNFQNKKEFTEKIGFDTHHWGEYANSKVRRYAWGYDDCGFYEETAKKLREEKTEKPVFAYISLSSHHVNFTAKEEYKSLWPFPKNENYTQETLNSARTQDYCLEKFMEDFADIIENSHIFILSDHSFPTPAISGHGSNQQGVSADNFLVPVAYLPPKSQRDAVYMGQVIDGRHFSHADWLPTIFELLNGKNYTNSFAFALRKNANTEAVDNRAVLYEECQLFTQPYNGSMVSVLRGNDKYNYNVQTGEVTHINIIVDLPEKNPEIIANNVSYQQFVDTYYCDRYKLVM